MIEVRLDYPLNFITYTESYMFATSRRHYERYTSFEGFDIVVAKGSQVWDYRGVQDVDMRLDIVKHFNELVSSSGWELNKRSFVSTLSYFGVPEKNGDCLDCWYDDYVCWEKAVRAFAAKGDRIVVFSSHFDELLPNFQKKSLPHAHVLYSLKPNENDAFETFVTNMLVNEMGLQVYNE